MQLTEHFSLFELTRSARAEREGIDNTPPDSALPHLQATAQVLENVRAFLGSRAGRAVPLLVTSGYRCPALNRRVGGVPGGPHTTGDAADVQAPAFGTPLQLARALAPHISALGIGQLIYEHLGGKSWVHIGTRASLVAANRVITISDAGTQLGIQEVLA